MLKVVVLISGAGTNMLSLLDAVQRSHPDARSAVRIVAVGADRDAAGLAEAARRGVPTFIQSWQRGGDRETWADALARRIAEYQPDLVVLSGFMRILPASFVEGMWPRLINTHPALLPAFPGAHAVQDALDAGVVETGATVHLVDAGMDTGPIIAQRPVPIHPHDSVETLHGRIKDVERELLADVVFGVAEGKIDLSVLARASPSE